MPRLRVLAGSALDQLVPVSPNSDIPVDVSSDAFQGKVAVYIKGFPDASGRTSDSPYFHTAQRSGITWSFQVQGAPRPPSTVVSSTSVANQRTGRFLHPHSADDILFGNTFERPLKLPWGFGAAVKFMQCVSHHAPLRVRPRPI